MHRIVLSDRKVKLRELTEAVGLKRTGGIHFARCFRDEKVIGTMGAAFADHRPKTAAR